MLRLWAGETYLAVLTSIRTSAGTEAELLLADERRPLVVLESRAEGVAEEETTDRVAVVVRTVGVELTSGVASRDVELGEVTDTSDLAEHDFN
jgi:hypothetical protein